GQREIPRGDHRHDPQREVAVVAELLRVGSHHLTARVAEGLAGEELKVVDGLRDLGGRLRPVPADLIDPPGCGRKLPPAQPVGRPQQDRHTLFGGSARPGGKRLLRRRDRRADLLGRRLLADGHDLVFLRGVVGVEFVFRSDTLAADDQGELFAELCGDRAQRLLHRRAARIGRKIGEWFVAKLRKRHGPPPGLAACALRWASTFQYTTIQYFVITGSAGAGGGPLRSESARLPGVTLALAAPGPPVQLRWTTLRVQGPTLRDAALANGGDGSPPVALPLLHPPHPDERDASPPACSGGERVPPSAAAQSATWSQAVNSWRV